MERKQSINAMLYRRDRVIAKIDLSKTEHGAGATFFEEQFVAAGPVVCWH